jgi:1-acyl-sn-glycerol-3-phosphate acyltransferase
VSDSGKATETNRLRPTYAGANVGHPSISLGISDQEVSRNSVVIPEKVFVTEKGARSALVPPSPRILAFFRIYLRWYIGRHFHALRLANSSRFPVAPGPLIIYANHASWWDPLTFMVVANHLLPAASHYGPMDAAALQHYGVLRKLGLFAVENGTPRGAAQFLRAAREILATPDSVLWVTPEGQFTDMRTRPAVFRPGLAALVARLGACTLVPLAFEYTFWDERLPEILGSCGQAIQVTDGRSRTAAEWSEHLAAAMTACQDELAALAKLREPEPFATILSGRTGIGGVYEAWKRLFAILSGRTYQGSHGSISHL